MGWCFLSRCLSLDPVSPLFASFLLLLHIPHAPISRGEGKFCCPTNGHLDVQMMRPRTSLRDLQSQPTSPTASDGDHERDKEKSAHGRSMFPVSIWDTGSENRSPRLVDVEAQPPI